MTQDQHPITPPPELVRQWDAECESGNNAEINSTFDALQQFACKAARWGADQELEECCQWLDFYAAASEARDLRVARRPKPSSLKEQAIEALAQVHHAIEQPIAITIRRALEALPDD